MLSGRQQLRDWIDRQGINQTTAAKLFGVHDVVLCQWLNGDKRPGLPNAIMLEDRTGISARSWLLKRVSRKRSRLARVSRKLQLASQ
jgi:transposase